ncbi:ParB/Sulfiredoxin [uncultured Caudovirales phage]|uniref:ParB/Sulfiredoxin n=1 Tax=uncultured Caudovirales phage TaxID=2100421 RepID=A0A6J7X068_9CAUD|nr:ParB/Sulfiredoxin [uncultured Caudovirales phage]
MIEKVKITEVIANPNNPRVIRDDKFKKLVKSINEFPQMLELRPIVVNDEMIVLGGNMRLKACKEAGLKEVHIIKASDLSEAQQAEFIIKDNVGFGEWDWDMLANEYNDQDLKDWGVDIPKFEELGDYGEDFSLSEGDKSPFQQITFTLADEQAEQIKNAIADIKQTEEYKYAETMGNENSNGNALYLIIMQWIENTK